MSSVRSMLHCLRLSSSSSSGQARLVSSQCWPAVRLYASTATASVRQHQFTPNRLLHANGMSVERTVRHRLVSLNSPVSLWARHGRRNYHNYSSAASPRPASSGYLGSVLFALAVIGGTFTVAAVTFEHRHLSLLQRAANWYHRDRISPAEYLRTQQTELRELLRERLDQLSRQQSMPELMKRVYATLLHKWYSMTRSEHMLCGIVAANTAVFLAWQIPVLAPFMARHFMHTPGITHAYTLLTACFSHRELWHFGFNMMALWSFGQAALQTMSPEEFLAFYLSAGTLASLGSHLMSLRFRQASEIMPSLGASGAVFGVFATCAWRYPDAQVHMIFLPMLPIKIGHGLAGLMALDLVGALRGWRMFDHYAHLSGALSGLAYMQYGHQYVWQGLHRRLAEKRKQANQRR